MNTVQRIRDRAKEKGLKLNYICSELGLTSRTYFNDIEKNGREIPSDRLKKIAEILNTTPEYLLGITDNKEKEPSANAKDSLGENERKLLAMYDLVPEERRDELLSLIEAALKMQGLL